MTDSEDIDALEKALLCNPFDHKLRLQYSQVLEAAQQYEEAAQQYGLTEKASTESAVPIVGRARCLLGLGHNENALSEYIRAKKHPDFMPDPSLENLADQSKIIRPSIALVRSNNVSELTKPAENKVNFLNVVGMDALKKTLRLKIIEPFRNPGLFNKFRKKAGGGVLLYGPPGCGKTLIARAIASECNASFISIGISDVLNMWVGESERNLASLFEEARECKPCVMFFDELDALAYSRSKSSSSHSRTVVNEFLAQLDGFDHDNEQILILAATNMPWDIDPAMKRPGRFSNLIFVPPPDKAALEAMLVLKLEGVPVEQLDLAFMVSQYHNFSGADIDGLIDGAKEHALIDMIDSGEERVLTMADFDYALEFTTPSTIEWLQTARNLVKFSGTDNSYREVKRYLKKVKLY